jgi:hypothetical protein
MAERDDLIGPPRPVRAQGMPIEPKQKDPVQAALGGRPPGSVTTAPPSVATQGPPSQAMTPLGAPAPAPSRGGLAAGDSREPALKAGEPPLGGAPPVPREGAPQAQQGLQEAQAKGAQPAGPALATAPMAGGAPGLSAEPQLPEVTLTRDLYRDERERAAPGVYNTPSGTIRKNPNGEVEVLALSPELKARIKKFEARVLKEKFGPYPGMEDPNAPKPKIEAGSRWFNPFTGQFGIAEPDQL